VTRGVNDGEVVLLGLELPESDIDGDTALTLSLELIEHPGVLERALANIVGLLLELLDRTLVDTTSRNKKHKTINTQDDKDTNATKEESYSNNAHAHTPHNTGEEARTARGDHVAVE
jgi:hypothetical protein